MHIISPEQFTPDISQEIFERAEFMRAEEEKLNGKAHLAMRHIGRTMCNLFYEPSTRTRLSFGFAAGKLGLHVEGSENASQFSSAIKGETLEDTIRVLNAWNIDFITIRHTDTGSAQAAADVCTTSTLINGGDGTGDHPTQSLLDVYTIQKEKQRLDNLRVTIGGDLKYGRTARSLAKTLASYSGNHIDFVSTPELRIGEDIKNHLALNGTSYTETTDMFEAIREADVVYWTRLQRERQAETDPDNSSYRKFGRIIGGILTDIPILKRRSTAVEPDTSGAYVIDGAALEVMRQDAIILHPLPRAGEIAPEVDDDPRAKYLDQAGNGLYIRMALIDRNLNMK